MIEFHLDGGSGVAAYMQIVQQVKQALRLGILRQGDQLPTVRDVVATLAINPNTVLKAYRQLELEGLVAGRQGRGTFVLKTLASPDLAGQTELQEALVEWLDMARAAGMDDKSIAALMATTLREQTIAREQVKEGTA
jgi:GntR family transcriptional regulator